MTYEWRFLEDTYNGLGRAKRYTLYGIQNEKEVYVTIEDGVLKVNPLDEASECKPLFTVSNVAFSSFSPMLQAIADGLKDMGYLQKINEEERIKEKALSEERKNEMEYFKDLNTKLICSLIKEEIK
jgi:hypothetical protein